MIYSSVIYPCWIDEKSRLSLRCHSFRNSLISYTQIYPSSEISLFGNVLLVRGEKTKLWHLEKQLNVIIKNKLEARAFSVNYSFRLFLNTHCFEECFDYCLGNRANEFPFLSLFFKYLYFYVFRKSIRKTFFSHAEKTEFSFWDNVYSSQTKTTCKESFFEWERKTFIIFSWKIAKG